MCPLVSALPTDLSRIGGDDGRTRIVGRTLHDCWLDLHYAPILSRRIRREMRQPNRSWRIDETYVLVAGKSTYLYRAIDSRGDTIEFRCRRTGI